VSDYIVSINVTPEELAYGVQPIFEKVCEAIDDEFRVTLDSPVFAWNSVTKRKNGEIVSDPRNAIDLGGLRESQTLSFLPQPGLAVIEWCVPYAEVEFDHSTVDLVDFTLSRLRV